MPKLRVGITGCIGSGKSTVANMLKAYDAVVVDMDAAGRWAVEQNVTVQHELRRVFGDSMFEEHGGLNRKKLATLIFADATALAQLNGIVDPVMLARVREQISLAETGSPKAPYIVVDAALVFELNFDQELDRVVTVSAPLELCFKRVQSRTGLARSEIVQRYLAQLSQEEKIARSDYVVENDGSMEALRIQVRELDHWLMQQTDHL
jgi:dephospho-CoA kinase